MSFRPALVPTVFVAIGLFILLNLGAWQLRRNVETSTAIARFEERLVETPVGPEQLGASEDLSWRMAELRGRFVSGDPMFVTGRGEFGEIGYDLVQPFEVEGGPKILVNRGWIPREGWRQIVDRVAPPADVVEVRGLLLPTEQHAPRAPFSACAPDTSRPIAASDDAPERWPPNAWTAMADAAGAEPIVVVAGEPLKEGESKDREQLPVTGFHAKPKTLPHLQYAATWFLIAATLLVIWIVAGFRRGRALQG